MARDIQAAGPCHLHLCAGRGSAETDDSAGGRALRSHTERHSPAGPGRAAGWQSGSDMRSLRCLVEARLAAARAAGWRRDAAPGVSAGRLTKRPAATAPPTAAKQATTTSACASWDGDPASDWLEGSSSSWCRPACWGCWLSLGGRHCLAIQSAGRQPGGRGAVKRPAIPTQAANAQSARSQTARARCVRHQAIATRPGVAGGHVAAATPHRLRGPRAPAEGATRRAARPRRCGEPRAACEAGRGWTASRRYIAAAALFPPQLSPGARTPAGNVHLGAAPLRARARARS